MGVFIGLNVSLAKTSVCVVDGEGTVLWQGKVPSEPEPLVSRSFPLCAPLSDWYCSLTWSDRRSLESSRTAIEPATSAVLSRRSPAVIKTRGNTQVRLAGRSGFEPEPSELPGGHGR
jgi:hypothetical protein